MTATTPTKPYGRIRVGLIQATIWRNTDTEGRAYYSTTFEKRYQDAQNEWHSTSSFHRDDLLLLGKATDMAFNRIHADQVQDRANAASDKQLVNGR